MEWRERYRWLARNVHLSQKRLDVIYCASPVDREQHIGKKSGVTGRSGEPRRCRSAGGRAAVNRSKDASNKCDYVEHMALWLQHQEAIALRTKYRNQNRWSPRSRNRIADDATWVSLLHIPMTATTAEVDPSTNLELPATGYKSRGTTQDVNLLK